MVVVEHLVAVAQVSLGGRGDADRASGEVARPLHARHHHGDAAVALLAAVELAQDRFDDPPRLLVVLERDRLLVVERVGVGGGVLAGHDRVAAEVLVGDAVLVHVALVPERVDLRRGVEAEREVPVPTRRRHPRLVVLDERLPEAPPRALVERAVDHHRIGRARCDCGRGVLHRGARPTPAAPCARGEAQLRDADAADDRQLVVDVDGEGHRAVDVGGGEAGVGDGRRHRLAGELQLAAAGVLGELGLADADDGGVACECAHGTTAGRNWGRTTPSTGSMLERDLHPVADVAGIDAQEVGDEADAVVEIDEDHDAGFGVGLGRVVRDDPGVDGPVSRGLLRVPLHRVALAAHRRRRVAQGAAGGAPLEDQATVGDGVPEELVVEGG